MTSYDGWPPAPVGALDHLVQAPARRLYETADGWIAVSADGSASFFGAVGGPSGKPNGY